MPWRATIIERNLNLFKKNFEKKDKIIRIIIKRKRLKKKKKKKPQK